MKNYLNSIDALDSALQREGRYLIESPGKSSPDTGTADWRGFALPFRAPDWLLHWWTKP